MTSRILSTLAALAATATLAGGCTRHLVANDVKLVAFGDDVHKGKGVGEIEGDDCIFQVLGYRMGGLPRVDRAIRNAQHQRHSEVGDVVGGGANNNSGDAVRYINGMHIEPDGFDVGVFGKDCLAVRGMGYK